MSKTSDQALKVERPVGGTDVVGRSATASPDANPSREGAFGTPVEARQGSDEEPGASLGGDAMPGNDLWPYETRQELTAAAGDSLESRQGSGKAGEIGEKGKLSEEELAAYTRVIEGHAGGALPGVLIAVAYPERIAQRQSRGNRCGFAQCTVASHTLNCSALSLLSRLQSSACRASAL